MGDRKQPNPPPGAPGSTAPPQRRPDPPPAPPPRREERISAADIFAPTERAGLHLGDRVVDRFAHVKVIMSVAGVRNLERGRSVLCTWTEDDGQAYHEWIPEGLLEMHREKVPVPAPVAYLQHVRCGQPVSIAVLKDDVAYYVYCEACHDLVEEGELHPPVDEAQVRLRVDRERVRPVHPDERTVETRAVDPLSDATDGRMR